MKKIFIVPFVCLCAASLFAQPAIEWAKTYGGSMDDGAALIPAIGGGYLLAGGTTSADGDVAFSHGKGDGWLVKLSTSGAIEWQKSYGGSENEGIGSAIQTHDGGYMLAGTTSSSDGDLEGAPENQNGAWLIKIDSTGNILWQKTFYEGSQPRIRRILQTSDDGYVFACDFFGTDSITVLMKLDADGNLQWKTKESAPHSMLTDLIQTADGDFLACGYRFVSLDAQSNLLVARYDPQGNKRWERMLGGNKFETAYSVTELAEGGFMVAGITESYGGDVTNNYGIGDCWLVKLSEDGDVIWDKNYGGSYDDGALGIIQTIDGGFLMTAYTFSNDHDVLLHYFGDADIWLVKLDPEGVIQWQITLGGYNYESAFRTYQTSDGGFILAGYTRSVDENVEFNHGLGDVWVVKLSAVVAAHEPAAAEAMPLSPNPAHDVVSLQAPAGAKIVQVDITDMAGHKALRQNAPGNSRVDISSLPQGAYLVTATTTSGEVLTSKLMKQ